MPAAGNRSMIAVCFLCSTGPGAFFFSSTAPAAAQDGPIADPAAYCGANFKDMKERVACLERAIAGLLDDDRCRAIDLSALVDRPPVLAQTGSNEAEAVENYDLPTGLGAERVELPREIQEREDEKTKKAETLEASVERLVRTSRGTYIFYLENDQVWRQKDSDSVRNMLSTKRNYEVTISSGLLSGYRLKVKGVPRQMLVDRIE